MHAAENQIIVMNGLEKGRFLYASNSMNRKLWIDMRTIYSKKQNKAKLL